MSYCILHLPGPNCPDVGLLSVVHLCSQCYEGNASFQLCVLSLFFIRTSHDPHPGSSLQSRALIMTLGEIAAEGARKVAEGAGKAAIVATGAAASKAISEGSQALGESKGNPILAKHQKTEKTYVRASERMNTYSC